MNFKDVIKRVFLYFKRDPKECVALICAACIMAISFLTASYPVFAAATSWDDVSADAIALKNAYIDYFKSLSSSDFGDVLGSAVDIPISWLKTMSDGALAISPVDDLYYYLKDGVLQYEDNREHRSGGGGGRRRGEATEIKPELPVSTVKQINDYWSSHFKPHENSQEYIWSYQTAPRKNDSDIWFVPGAPVYSDARSWGNKLWDDFYIMPFFTDDDLCPYYGQYYYRCYTTKEDQSVIFHFDQYYLADNSLFREFKTNWKAAEYPFIGLLCSGGGYQLYAYSSRENYFSDNRYFDTKYSFQSLEHDGAFVSLRSYNHTGDKLLKDLVSITSFTPNTNKSDDWGFICSSEPFELFANQTKIDYEKIPDNYTITINGDTIYDYDITNPDTGDHGTVNYYITNNYTLPENGSKDDTKDDPGSGTVSGNVTVGGKVDVSGKIEIDTKPIDININVNGGGSGSSGSGDVSSSPEGVEFDQDVSLNNYYDWMQEQTTGFSGFMKNFFSWLPDPIVIMLCAGFALVILARFLGR